MYRKYNHIGRIEQLKNSGREFIGKKIIFTVKRDGQNCPIYIDNDEIKIGSRNFEEADENIINGVKSSKEWSIVQEMMKEFPQYVIYVEHMEPGRGPVKIEMPRKSHSLILIDMFDLSAERYVSYNFLHQIAHRYRMPIVEMYTEFVCDSLVELYLERDNALSWCKKHKKEGVVIKDYYSENQIFVKEKIDLPKPKRRMSVKDETPKLPPMPLDKIMSAVDQAISEIKRNGGNIKSPKDAMPTIAIYINTEAREHCYRPPNNLFQYYQDYLRNENE